MISLFQKICKFLPINDIYKWEVKFLWLVKQAYLTKTKTLTQEKEENQMKKVKRKCAMLLALVLCLGSLYTDVVSATQQNGGMLEEQNESMESVSGDSLKKPSLKKSGQKEIP